MKVSDKMKETIKRSRKFSSTMWLSEQTGLYYIGYGHIIPVNKIKEFTGIKITKKMAIEENYKTIENENNYTVSLEKIKENLFSYSIVDFPSHFFLHSN